MRLKDGPTGQITALLGPRGADRKDVGHPLPDGFTFVVHPGLGVGEEYQLKYPEPKVIRAALGIPAATEGLRYVEPLTVRDYRDPVAKAPGLWTAALAPVDETGFVVLVESPREPDRSRWAFLSDQDSAIPLALFGVGLAVALRMHLQAQSSLRGSRRRHAWIERG